MGAIPSILVLILRFKFIKYNNYPIGTALIKFKVEETGSLIYTYEILDLVILM